MNNGSSPHKARNYQSVVNAVLIYLRTKRTVKRVAVLVEGTDDEKAYRKFFDQNISQLFVCTGKDALQKYLQELSDKTKQAIGIQDADFSNLEKIKPSNTNLFFTDCHDLEMTILSFKEVREALFSEYGEWNKMNTVWESIVKKASFIGYVRWFNEKNDTKLLFEGFFNEYGSIDEAQLLLDKLNDRSQEKRESITKKMIDAFIARYSTDDIFNLCNGHDVSTLLAFVLKINTKSFSSALRLSFQFYHFMQTQLYANLLSWQNAHGFDILKTNHGASNG
jgi:hypothetical protein